MLRIPLKPEPVVPEASGMVILEEKNGKEIMTIEARNLPAKQRFNVFLAAFPVTNSLPANFLGSLVTDENGSGFFEMQTQLGGIFKSFAVLDFNSGFKDRITDSQGTILYPVIPLRHIRINFAKPVGEANSAFDYDGLGGPAALTGVFPLIKK